MRTFIFFACLVAWLFHLNLESRVAFPYPQHGDMCRKSILVNQQVNNVSNCNFSHFCARKHNILVKFIDNSLVISAVPFRLSDNFFLLFFQAAINAPFGFTLYPVLLQVAVEVPMHALDGPMPSGYQTKPFGTAVQA